MTAIYLVFGTVEIRYYKKIYNVTVSCICFYVSVAFCSLVRAVKAEQKKTNNKMFSEAFAQIKNLSSIFINNLSYPVYKRSGYTTIVACTLYF